MLKLSQFPIAITYIAFFFFVVFSADILYSQTLDSPPYGISVEKWEKMHNPSEYHLNGNSDNNGGGLLINGGFETGDFTGWVTQDLTAPFFPLQVGTAGVTPWSFFISDPTEGTFAALHGWDGNGPGTIRLAQDVTLPSNAVTLEFDYRAAWDLQTYGATLDRIFMVNIEPGGGGSPLQTNTVLTAVVGTINYDTGDLHGSINVSAYAGSSIRISFDWTVPEFNSGPAFFQLDDVFIIPVESGPQIMLSPSGADFGLFEVGTSSTSRTVTIRSVGSENLTVSGISDPGSPFILSNVPALPVIIPPGGSETFEVTFSPTSGGVFNNSITVTSDDPDNPTRDILLSGESVTINPATLGVCYASTGNNDGGRLLTIDLNTGAGTLIGPTGLNNVPGLAINSNGDMYGTDGANGDLYKIDASTGTAIFIASTGLSWLPAIAFDGSDVLYGIGTDFTSAFNLYTINTTTGIPTLIGPTTSTYEIRGMAFDPTDGTLWASTNGEDIYIINPFTGESTFIGMTGLGHGTPDIHFDDIGNLYGAAGGGTQIDNLVSINKTTGTATIIGSIGLTSVSGLATRHLPLTGPQIGIIPGTGIVNFRKTEVGNSSSPITVTIRSIGSENLTVSGISDPGSPFIISNVPALPVVIPPGGSETFEVTFSPTSEGDFNSSIMVTSDDADNPTKDISLSGKSVIINPSMSGVCYASTGHNDGGRLLTIDLSTGHGTLIGLTGLKSVPGLAINSNGIMFGIDGDNFDLYKIDAATGTAVFVASTGILTAAIAFDDKNVLYGLGIDIITGQWNLYTINTVTGTSTPIGPTGSVQWRGMAFDPTDGTIWASTSGEEIFVINPNTGTSTLIGTTGLDIGTPDLCFDDIGNLYGVVGGGRETNLFVSIDKNSGKGTNIGIVGFSFTSVSGLAGRHELPLTGKQIGFIPGAVNFLNTEVGTSRSGRTVTIRSAGTENITVSVISNPGSPFSLSNAPSLPVVIAPDGSETFEVTFSPTSTGVFNSIITVTSDDADNPTKEVSLSGEGVVINPAMPGVCYASTGNNDGGRLLTIDINTGAGTLIGPTGLSNVPGLAINLNGDIYGIDGNFDLYKIDAATGSAIFIAKTGLLYLPAIAFNSNDVLYGLGYDAVTFTNNLYTINTTTGESTVVGPAPMGNWRGMAFNPIDGTLWGSTSWEEIYKIDPTTGTPTFIGNTGLFTGTPDIFFDKQGNLYGAAGGGVQIDDLVSINKTTGVATSVGSIGFTSVSGLSFSRNPVSVEDEATSAPTVYSLLQNYPNPFNPKTSIKYAIPKESFVRIKVYNIIGEEVVELVNEVKKVGNYTVQFNASRLASGIYFYRIQAGDFSDTKKMVVLK